MSRFEYNCFISYRNGRQPNDRLNTFTQILVRKIRESIDGYLPDMNIRDAADRFIFLDQEIFVNATFDAQALGRGLCKSVCWIVLFSRNYFSGSLWCASEYHGMLTLEKMRLTALNQEHNADLGFIIPIQLAGDEEEMPDGMRHRKRHLKDFRKFFLRSNFENDNDFEDMLTEMLDKIGRVHKVVLPKIGDICRGCDAFQLENVNTDAGKGAIAEFVSALYPPPQPRS
jgi:hypothetical protein